MNCKLDFDCEVEKNEGNFNVILNIKNDDAKQSQLNLLNIFVMQYAYEKEYANDNDYKGIKIEILPSKTIPKYKKTNLKDIESSQTVNKQKCKVSKVLVNAKPKSKNPQNEIFKSEIKINVEKALHKTCLTKSKYSTVKNCKSFQCF
ncbi:hypothetical protein A3Q56_06936 [Intoshia linei]|uniref:Uncharacterized protein n=1 Tax=Intoshia linei TaxID=1819745 RepID=A0A177ATJ6_9BILA|nr:hypothetical protein A3Q56_06936 [Intoshia linei]